MSWRIFTFEDTINTLDVIVHGTSSYYYAIIVERYRKKSPTEHKSRDSDLCVMVADSRRECDKLIINHESHALFSGHVLASLNKSDDERYNIGCVYNDHDTLVKKFNELVNHLISIGFPIIKAREADE